MSQLTLLLKNTVAFLLPMLLLLSCQPEKNEQDTNLNRKTITKLQVKYVSFFMTTITRVNCSDFDEWFKEQTKVLTIENDDFLAKFDQELHNLKPIDETFNPEPDARALIDISYSDGSGKRACLSLTEIEMDGQVYVTSERLRQLLTEKHLIEIPK